MDFEERLQALIDEARTSGGVGWEDIVSALELTLLSAKEQASAENDDLPGADPDLDDE